MVMNKTNEFTSQVYPAQALNVPAVPLGTLLAAAYPWASGPPYLFSWLNHQISAQDMMHPELLSKLVFNNFCEYSLITHCHTGFCMSCILRFQLCQNVTLKGVARILFKNTQHCIYAIVSIYRISVLQN